MKLNLGSGIPKGAYRGAEWVNVDLVRFDPFDRGVQADVLAGLPFRDGAFEEVRVVHVLEHVTRDTPPRFLMECYRVLSPQGTIFVEVPDFPEIVSYLHQAFLDDNARMQHVWTTSIYGKNEKPGMAHYEGFTFPKLRRYLEEVGFKNVQRQQDMISNHHLMEPVILVKGLK